MEFKYECLWCHVNQARRIAELVDMDEVTTEATVRKVLHHLSVMPYEGTNPKMMAQTWEIMTKAAGDENPYKEIKKAFNAQMLGIYDTLKENLMKDEDPFASGVHLAVEGNIIDYGAKHEFSAENTLEQLLGSERESFALDETETLRHQLSKAKRLLYIGDNCGEIVMDKLFIEVIRNEFPHLGVTFGVRGKPILNDVTVDDADQIAMEEVAEVISNGSGAPGTVMSMVSDEFEETFNRADVVISKGQGNFESLSHSKKDNLFFLFMGKCETVTEEIGVPLMSKMCTRTCADSSIYKA